MLRGGTRYSVSTDQVGSPRLVTDETGSVVKALTYSAYGETLSDSDPSFQLPIGFGGGIADPQTRLVRMGMRDYDPASGRFTTRDPLLLAGGDANLFDYAGGDPIQNSDPLGLTSVGGTLCDTICVGLKWSITKNGFSACVETGFGSGDSLELTPDGGLDPDKAYLKASAEMNLGPFAGYEYTDELSSDGHCRKHQQNRKVCVVGGCVDSSDGIKLDTEKMADAFKKKGVGVETKLTAGVCQQVLW
jgi:RHS repeat-associated protein